jgi:hypothetical protein
LTAGDAKVAADHGQPLRTLLLFLARLRLILLLSPFQQRRRKRFTRTDALAVGVSLRKAHQPGIAETQSSLGLTLFLRCENEPLYR